MKKFYSLIATAILAVNFTAQTSTTVVSEPFTYTGALNANGWSTHSGTAGQLLSNGSQAITVAGNSEDVNKAFSTSYSVEAGKINEVNYSATLNLPNGVGLTTAGDYFMMLSSAAGTTGVSNFYARLYVKGSATGYTLGILNNSGGTANPTYGVEIPYDNPANITVTYTINNTLPTPTNVATLKINAQPLLTNATGTGGIPTTLAAVAIRESGTASTGTGRIFIDDVVVKTISAVTLAVADSNSMKDALVKNTKVSNTLIFAANADIQLINANGQVVKTASVKQNSTLEINTLPKGVYFVKGNVNGKLVSQTIIKK